MKKRICLIVALALLSAIIITVLYRYNYIPHRKFDNADFSISVYKSSIDCDNDTIDDQTDIIESALEYLNTDPKYKSKYYPDTGYPNDEYGVCTDVVAFALKKSGYDLMELVYEDIIENPENYDIDVQDKYIDFRRVENLNVYFENNAISLTTDTNEIAQWQAGDIVVFKRHIGIISNHRNSKGVPFVLHNAHPFQATYEEDILATWGKIVGHYRIS